MTNRIANISRRKAALIAGVGLLIMSILAVFANFFVIQRLVVSEDAAATANNIIANKGLFRAGICSFLIVAILDVVVAWALYVLLKPVNRGLALLAAWFRLVYAAVFGFALVNLFSVLQLTSGADYLTVFEPNQLHAQVMLFVNVFEYGWDIGIVFFGVHLALLGYLVFKAGYVRRILGILLMVASLGYLIDAFGKFISPNYNVSIATFTFIGELLLMVWLLWKGIKGLGNIPEKEM